MTNAQNIPGEAAVTKAEKATRFRTTALSHRKPTRFHWHPNAEQRAAVAEALALEELTSLAFKGQFIPEGRADFRLEAHLQAEVVQSCVVTLVPLPAKIDEEVVRRYLLDWVESEADEVEMSPDDTTEGMPESIDITEVATEALSLALDPYPRAPGAELEETLAAPPGEVPLKDDDLKPFAGLASLLKTSEKPGGASGSDDGQ